MKYPAHYWIEKLSLHHHVEGGSFREVYRSPLTASLSSHPSFKGERSFCTSIYFLLEKGQFSAFHKIASDEVWHFYSGDTLLIYEIEPDGRLLTHRLGNDPAKGASFQCMIRAGNWFGSVVEEGGDYALVGCTVSPGFDFADFELAKQDELIAVYPQHAHLIRRLTRD